MTLPLLWTDEATDDLLQITQYIAERNAAAAERMNALLRRTAERLPQHPFMHRLGRIAGTREAVAHPNYILVYEVTEIVKVIAIQHARQQYP